MAIPKFKHGVLLFLMFTSLVVHSQSASQEPCSSGKVSMAGDDQAIEITAEQCADVTITGNGNTIDAAGIGKLIMIGEGNTVSVAGVDDLQMVGNENTITAAVVGKIRMKGDDNEAGVDSVTDVGVVGNGNKIIYGTGPEPQHSFVGEGNRLVVSSQ